jgi:uncharacterized membrane protein
VIWPLAAQTLSVAAGGVILFWIAQSRLPHWPWLSVGFALSYYLHPAVHSTLLWQYHELVLASGLYIGLIWSYVKGRKKLFLAMVLLLLACREDMPFTVAAFGVFAATEKRWTYAAVSIGLAIVWWIMAVKLAMPYFNEQGYFRHQHGTLGPLFANIANPHFYVERLLDHQSLQYLWRVFFPVGFIALLSPKHLLPALPALVANLLIGGYNTDIGYHYSVNIMPFVYWGVIEATRRWVAGGPVRFASWDVGIAAAMTTMTLLAYSQYSSLNLRLLPTQIRDWHANAPKRAFLQKLDMTIGEKGVAASDFLVPHLSHRENIYLFPNPWKIHYWGIAGEHPHHPNKVDYLVLDSSSLAEQIELVDYLTTAGLFRVTLEQDPIVVLERVMPEPKSRKKAVANFEEYFAADAVEFTELALSPSIATGESEFRRVDVDLTARQQSAGADWTVIGLPASTKLLDIKLGEPNGSEFRTRYVRAVVTANKPSQARLYLGSDDGVTVWLNGALVHEHIAPRPARLGDDRLPISLSTGKNVFLFRVNNINGNWQLLAKVRINQFQKTIAE